jgi:serine/threonine protein kinase
MISSHIEGGTIPWMSPELLDLGSFNLKKSHPTKESDCYALGMVVYEVLSGRVPFAPSSPAAIILKVHDGQRPSRPQGNGGRLFTDGTWEVLELCWKHQPGDRINAKAVLLGLEGDLPSLGPSPTIDEDMETDSNDQPDTITSDSGMFSLFPVRLIFTYPCTVAASLFTLDDNELLDPPQEHLPNTANPGFGILSPSHFKSRACV